MKIDCENIENQLLGMRKGKAYFGEREISIPVPIVTSTEINYADMVTQTGKAKKIKFPHDLWEIKSFINPKKFKRDFLTPANRVASLADIKAQVEKAGKYMEKRPLTMFTPILSEKLKVDEHVIEELVNFQIEAKMDIVNIPNSKSIQLTNLATVAKTIKDKGREPFYLIHMREGNRSFVNKIDTVKGLVSGVTAIYADPHEKFDNYAHFMKLGQECSLFRIISNIPRRVSRNINGPLHPLTFLVSDAYSVEYPIIKHKKGEKKKEIIPKRLSIETMEFFTAEESVSNDETDPYCDCPVCNDYTIDIMMYIYGKYLPAAFRVHETFASNLFVERCKSIGDAENLRKFLLSLEGAKKALSHTFMPEIGQKQF